MSELVGHDQPDLRGIGTGQERVEHDHTAGSAEPGHVRVLLRRPAAGVGHQDVADRDACPVGQGTQVEAEPVVRQRGEPVEHGFEHQGAKERQEHHETRAGRRGGQRPRRRQRPGQADEPERGPPAQHQPDAEDEVTATFARRAR